MVWKYKGFFLINFILLFLVLGMFVKIPVAEADITTGLLGYWNFDEGSGTTVADSSGNGHTATLVNDPAWIVGHNSNALNFDGVNDYVDTGYSTSLSQISISAWIKEDTFPNTCCVGIVTKGVVNFWIGSSGSLYLTRSFLTTGGQWATPAGSVTPGNWYHVVVTYNDSSTSNTPSIYINGVAQTIITENTPVGTAYNLDINYAIGTRDPAGNPSNPPWFDGIIDEVRIYSRVLTGSDVTELYNYTGAPPSPPPPPAPTITFNASPTSINSGETSVLSWSTSNSTNCSASDAWSGVKAISGNETVAPTATATYTLLCTGSGGTLSTSVTVTVNSPPPPPSGGNTYYVATTGNDGNSCIVAKNINTPKQTIQSGVLCLSAPGDILYIRGGTYTGSANQITNPLGAGEAGSSFATGITISGYPSETVIIQPPNGDGGTGIQLTNTNQKYLILQDFTVDMVNQTNGSSTGGPGAVYIAGGANHNRLQRLDIKNNQGNGIELSDSGGAANSPFNEILRNKIHHNGLHTGGNSSCGPGCNQGYGLYVFTSDNLFDGNEVYDNDGYGFHLTGSTNQTRNTISNNSVHDNGTQTNAGTNYGIFVSWGNDALIYNNLVYNNRGGIGLGLPGTTSNGQKAYNNTVYNNQPVAGGGISIYSNNSIVKNNIVFNNNSAIVDNSAGSVVSNNLTTNPSFTNAGANDFTLQAGSAAINTGTDLSAVFTTDYAGNTRPVGGVYDIGSYEYVGAVNSPPPPPSGGNTYYVATNGNDSNTCTQATSIGTPKKTVVSGLTCLSAGSILYLRAGTYAENLDVGSSLATGSSDGTRITVSAYPGETVSVRRINVNGNRRYWTFGSTAGTLNVGPSSGSGEIGVGGGESPGAGSGYIRFQNLNVTGNTFYDESCVGFSQGSVGFNEFLGGSVHDCDWPITHIRPAAHGFYVSSPNNLVDGTELYHIAQNPINNYADFPHNNTYRNLYIHDNGSTLFTTHGILLSGNDNVAYNNLVVNNKNGLMIYSGSRNKLYNNTVWGNGINTACGGFCYSAVTISPDNPIFDTEVKNNIFYNNSSNAITNSGTGTVQSNNLTTNPLFVNAAGNDFHLQSTSLAINTGATISTVTTDFAGATRPFGSAYDIGAYEFGGSVTPPPPPPPPPPSSSQTPIGWWKFDGNANDSSGNSLNGSLINGPTFATGKIGSALHFDGVNDSVNVPDNNLLDFTSNLTLAAWVNPDATYTDFRAILSKNYTYQLYASGSGTTYPTGGTCSAGSPLGNIYNTANRVACIGPVLPANTWTHLVTTYDSANIKLYKNGSLVAITPYVGTILTSTGSLQIGASQYGEYFTGWIDDVQLYNRAITSTEVQSLFTGATTPPPTPPPAASTKFSIGDTIQVTTNVNVRATASVSGALVGTELTGAQGMVVSGPINADGFNWWQISYTNGVSGWSAEDFLIKITVQTSPTPTVTISASPLSLTSGESVLLAWTSTNAITCTASGNWSGNKSVSGTESLTPSAISTYIITCTGGGGSANHSVSINVSTPNSVCSYATPSTGCIWQSLTPYPQCGGTLVCPTPTPTTPTFGSGFPPASVTTPLPVGTIGSVSNPQTSTPKPGTAFSIGNTVEATVRLNVRGTSDIKGALVGTQSVSSKGTVIAGPITQGVYIWWQIIYSNGVKGWSSETFLTKTTGSVTTSSLSLGDTVQTKVTIKVRSGAGGGILGSQLGGRKGKIVAGPVLALNLNWWKMDYDGGVDGWSAGDYLLKTTNAALSTKFSIGNTVTVSKNVNVRRTASISGTIIDRELLGAKGTVIGGPTREGGYSWWQVSFSNGVTGWSAEDFLTIGTLSVQPQTTAPSQVTTPPLVTTPVPTPTPTPSLTQKQTTFGNTSIGSIKDDGNSYFLEATKFTMSNQGGLSTGISVYISSPVSSAPNNKFAVAIYSDEGGLPGTLIASSLSQDIVANNWNTVPLSTALKAKTSYWLAYTTNGVSTKDNNVMLSSGSTNQLKWHTPNVFGTWAPSFGTVSGSAAQKMSIYVTYTVQTSSGDRSFTADAFTSLQEALDVLQIQTDMLRKNLESR